MGDSASGSDNQGEPQEPGSPGSPGSGGGFSGSDPGEGLPPEVEVKEDFERPQASVRYVYAANPESDSIAVIDATTLAIETVEAGDRPTYLQTVSGSDVAIVVNAGSRDATIVRTEASGSRTSTVGAVEGANAIRVAPDGTHAVLYYDPELSTGGGAYQDVAVVRLDAGGDLSWTVTVGFRPSAVYFSEDGALGFVVTEDGVSVLDFAEIAARGGGIARTVRIGETGREATLDVSVTRDGRFALAREQGASTLRLVDLDTGAISQLDLSTVVASVPPRPEDDGGGLPPEDGDAGTDGGSPTPGPGGGSGSAPVEVTDLDLSNDGTFALAVVRDRRSLLHLPIPDAFADPSLVQVRSVPGELIGLSDLSPDGRTVLLYTTADPSVERLTLIDLEDARAPRTVQLRKAVRSVAIAPDGRTVVVRHQRLPGDPNESGIDLDTSIDRSFGYSLVDLESGFAKLRVTPADVGRLTVVPDGSHVFFLFDDERLRNVERARLDTFQIDDFTLGSRPVSLGAIPGTNKIFVSQEHADGRIAFIDWVTGDVRSVTGFELNSRIRE